MKWQLYLSRPFDLLTTSIWSEWYCSSQTQDVLGVRFSEALFIESPRGISRHYRLPEDLDSLRSNVRSLILNDPERVERIYKQAFEFITEAEVRLGTKNQQDIKESLGFVIDCALHTTVFPIFAGEVLEHHGDPLFEVQNEKLRAQSIYPRLLAEYLLPRIEREVPNASMKTIREVLNGTNNVDERALFAQNKHFILEQYGDTEKLSYVVDPAQKISEIEGVQNSNSNVKGTPAFKGVIRGKVRLVLSNQPDTIFENGDVLVAISTNPNILPLMQKASAFVTDEGGVTCHAAIIARELKKPCIIGTKFATQILKDGDLVEVDANEGVVRVLNK